MLDCILPRLFRLFFVLLALLVAAPASRADTTTWRWLESSSGAIRLLRYSGGSVAPTVFWSGAPTASPVILSDGSSGMQSVLDAVVTYLFPPPAFNSVNSLLGDLAATLAAASASLAPVGGAVVQQIDTRTWRLLSRDNAPSQVLASGANTLSTAAADIVLCAPSLPVWRTALRCAASSGLVALDFASGATIDYTDTSSASIAFNFTLTLPYSVAAVGTLAAAPQSLVDLLALVAFRARQMREAAASIGTVLSANDARAGPAKVIAILFWTFLAASTLAFLCISAILQAWRLPCLAAFPFSFWLGIALSIAALAILGGGVTGWATLVFLCFVHIAVVCIMYCCRVDFCWPLFLRKCPALCCIKIADTSVVVDENSTLLVVSIFSGALSLRSSWMQKENQHSYCVYVCARNVLNRRRSPGRIVRHCIGRRADAHRGLLAVCSQTRTTAANRGGSVEHCCRRRSRGRGRLRLRTAAATTAQRVDC